VITHVGFCGRSCISVFQNRFYSRYARNSQVDVDLCDSQFGKSLSSFVYSHNSENTLFVFDGDDGSGGTATDCKISWPNYDKVVKKHDISEVVFLKLQCAREPEYHQFFPFRHAIPLGLMTDDPEKTMEYWQSISNYEKDIDVLFVGGKVHDRNTVYCWPPHRSLDAWWPGVRRDGYEKLLAIKESRSDLNIVCTDSTLAPSEYYSLVKRSKICLDLPGTARASRKFYEFLMFGKCALSLPQQDSILEWKEDYHYSSLGWDFKFERLEEKIDELLSQPSKIEFFESNAKDLSRFMSHESMISKTMDLVEKVGRSQIKPPIYNTLLRP
jgi:hypothetical protein